MNHSHPHGYAVAQELVGRLTRGRDQLANEATANSHQHVVIVKNFLGNFHTYLGENHNKGSKQRCRNNLETQ